MNVTIVSATPENLYVASASARKRIFNLIKQNDYFFGEEKKNTQSYWRSMKNRLFPDISRQVSRYHINV